MDTHLRQGGTSAQQRGSGQPAQRAHLQHPWLHPACLPCPMALLQQQGHV